MRGLGREPTVRVHVHGRGAFEAMPVESGLCQFNARETK